MNDRLRLLGAMLALVTIAVAFSVKANDAVEAEGVKSFGLALCNAEPGEKLTIELDPEIVYTFRPYGREDSKLAAFAQNCTDFLPFISSRNFNDVDFDLTIVGNGARVVGLTLVVEPGASLTVDSVDFDLSVNERPAIINKGTATIERSSFRGANFEILEGSRSLAISNDGTMSLSNTIVSANTTQDVCQSAFSTIHNTGDLDLDHAQIGPNPLPAHCESANIYNTGKVVARRSVIMTVGVLFACAGPSRLTSEGYNFQNFHPCTANLESTDINLRSNEGNPVSVRVSPTRWAPLFPESSPAADAIPAALCQGADFIGSPRTNESCDIGVLTGDGPTPATFHTLTGTWFDPGADGQYLQFQFPDYDQVLLTWQTFDEAGNNLWLYGLGTVRQNVASLDLYRNTGLALVNGEFEGSVEASRIGTATLAMDSCHKAEFSYAFGDVVGNATYRRLAFTRGITCINPGRR